MRIPIFQVDAFAGRVFAGNPAAVCPLETWLPDARMQEIAQENNLSETAFLVPEGDDYQLRWFTPIAEVDLCGHATLASAFVVFARLQPGRDQVRFHSRSGLLTVTRKDDLLVMDFPALSTQPCDAPTDLLFALGREPSAVLAVREGRDYMAVFETEADIREMEPGFAALRRLDRPCLIVTAPGEHVDFVSRFFAPGLGVTEDPVTGSAHCSLAPYWAERLGKPRMTALQVSERGGELEVEVRGDRVEIAGRAVLYLEGEIHLDDVGASST